MTFSAAAFWSSSRAANSMPLRLTPPVGKFDQPVVLASSSKS